MAQSTNFGELGTTGLERYSGVVQEEYLRELQGNKWLKKIAEMSTDPIIGAILLAVEMLLRQVEYNVEPADDSAQAQELAEFVEQCIADMSTGWEDTLSEILTMLPYGWAYLEVVYKRRQGDSKDPAKRSKYTDGRVGWRKWGIRSQDTLDRWEFGEDGGLVGLWQRDINGGKPPVLIPVEKALLFRTTSRKGNPEGRSLLRTAYRPYYFKHHIENIEGIGIERDLAGLPIAKAPPQIMSPSATPEQRAQFEMLKEIVVNIRRDEQEGVIWPLAYDDKGNELYKLELLTSGGERQFDTDKIIARYDQRIAMSVLADFILLGHEAVGSYALSATKSSLFKTALQTWLDSIADVINRHAIERLLRLNGMNLELAPAFTFARVGDVELADLTEFVSKMTSAGMQLFPSPDVENLLRAEVGLPPLSEDELAERERRQEQAEQTPATTPGEEDEPMADEQMAAMFQAAQRIVMRGY